MAKNLSKGCSIIFFQFLLLGTISLIVNFGSYLLPTDLAKLFIPMIVAAIPTVFIVISIYRIIMKRYYILAPSNPYEYNKMAQITLTKDDAIYVRKFLRTKN